MVGRTHFPFLAGVREGILSGVEVSGGRWESRADGGAATVPAVTDCAHHSP